MTSRSSRAVQLDVQSGRGGWDCGVGAGLHGATVSPNTHLAGGAWGLEGVTSSWTVKGQKCLFSPTFRYELL